MVDGLSKVDDEVKGQILISEAVALTAGQFVPIKVNYFEVESLAFVTLMYRMEGETQDVVVPASALFYISDHTPVSGVDHSINSYATPRKPTNLR